MCGSDRSECNSLHDGRGGAERPPGSPEGHGDLVCRCVGFRSIAVTAQGVSCSIWRRRRRPGGFGSSSDRRIFSPLLCRRRKGQRWVDIHGDAHAGPRSIEVHAENPVSLATCTDVATFGGPAGTPSARVRSKIYQLAAHQARAWLEASPSDSFGDYLQTGLVPLLFRSSWEAFRGEMDGGTGGAAGEALETILVLMQSAPDVEEAEEATPASVGRM